MDLAAVSVCGSRMENHHGQGHWSVEVVSRRTQLGSASCRRDQFRGARGALLHLAGAIGLWQDHHPALPGRAGEARRRRHLDRRAGGVIGPRRHFRPTSPARHRHGLSVLRHLAPHDRLRQRGLPPSGRQEALFQETHPGESGEGASHSATGRAGGPASATAQRGAATAPGPGPGSGWRAQTAASGRTSLQSGRQTAGADAHRAAGVTASPWDHHDLRHPRPGRGIGHVQLAGGHERGTDRAGGQTPRHLPKAQWGVCGRLHRLDQSHPGPRCADRRGGRTIARGDGLRAIGLLRTTESSPDR